MFVGVYISIMNHTNRIILCVFLFLILYVILKYINSLQKKPIIKENGRGNKKDLGNTEFYYDDGGNDYYPEPTVSLDTNIPPEIDVTETFIQ